MKYIDAYRLRAEIEKRKQVHFDDYFIKKSGNPADYGASNALAQLLSVIDSLQQEQPDVNLENKLEWHNVSEETPEFGDTVIVACKNKNKEDGIWLYDLIHCWEGKWETRENWETPLKWISVDELGLNARKEE